ncbi:60 kDa inner membrane insertion protein [Kribbella flavida DSM 17836]|uniref:Membrane protein insertase YidC n=1 Tax=Kribbella flavida (strain DSM 17836 / JCM 10339 / NBRC 14399) TaxID=479435 RepID=D2PLQ9_KRIFD|nr:membrane protein insertase YidC [Kribbella flavida]ADB32489.1 60 kDa inner membrane insertion protein [Kribbella flavida DSM 17836]
MPSFLDAPVSGAYHLVSWLATTIEPLGGPYAAALAIVVCTIAVRLLLLPLSLAAVRGEKSRSVLMPQIQEISRRHAGNPERAQREIAKLQAESGTTLFAGCLPMFAQLPFFWVLYSLFSRTVVAGESNHLLAGTLFGAPLGVHWPLFASTPAYVGLAVLLAVVACFSARRQLARLHETATPMSRNLARLLPFGTLVTAAFIPLAAGLYLLTTTTWTVVERAILLR